MYLLKTSCESIEFYFDAWVISETYWILTPPLKTLKNILDFCFCIKTVYDIIGYKLLPAATELAMQQLTEIRE